MMYKWEGISQASNFFVYCRMRKKNNTKRQYKLSNINCDNGTFQSHYHISFINNWEQNKTGFFLLLIVFVCFHSETTIFWLKKGQYSSDPGKSWANWAYDSMPTPRDHSQWGVLTLHRLNRNIARLRFCIAWGLWEDLFV